MNTKSLLHILKQDGNAQDSQSDWASAGDIFIMFMYLQLTTLLY